MKRLSFLLILCALLSLSACDVIYPGGNAYRGVAYVHTNEDANRVIAYGRKEDGALVKLASYTTGGAGTGGLIVPTLDRVTVDPLFSNDSIILTKDRKLLFVVNAGSGTVTSFRVGHNFQLERADTKPTDGSLPMSLTYQEGLLYVANVNDPPDGSPSTISGFHVSPEGSLTPIENSTRPITQDSAQTTHVLFSPDGHYVLVAEFGANTVSAYPVHADGTLGSPQSNAVEESAFGLGFLDDHTLISSNTPSSVSTYTLNQDGSLAPIDTLGNGQGASCWIALTHSRSDGGSRFAYISNTSSGNISLYEVTEDGQLTLLEAEAASKAPQGGVDVNGNPSSGPVDTFVSADDAYLYQHYSGRGTVVAYAIGDDGYLTEVGEFGSGDMRDVGSEGVDGF